LLLHAFFAQRSFESRCPKFTTAESDFNNHLSRGGSLTDSNPSANIPQQTKSSSEAIRMDLIYRFDPYQPLVVDRPGSADAAEQRLVSGNQRFVQFVQHLQAAALGDAPATAVVPIDLMSLGLPLLPGMALDQRPYAFVLGCSDARAPVEPVFDQNFNDLFVVRIAGNVLGTECLGSFDYAMRNFGDSMRLGLVLGHSGCGAVTAAVDAYLAPNSAQEISASLTLRSLVDRIKIAVRGAARELAAQAGDAVHLREDFRTLLIETSIYLNAVITAHDLVREASALDLTDFKVCYGVYDLSHMVVRDLPDRLPLGVPGGGPRLGRAPESVDEFLALSAQIARAALHAADSA
jgi:carbonic anhydrase